MNSTQRLVTAISAVFLGACVAIASAQDQGAKADEYYQALRERPARGMLFDRFVHAWLLEDSEESLKQFLITQSDNGKSIPDTVLLGCLYVEQGDLESAKRAFETVLKVNPNLVEIALELALLEGASFDYEEAITRLETALTKNPKPDLEQRLLTTLGKFHSRHGASDQAREVWEEALKRFPDDHLLREDLIDLQLDEGLVDAAIESARLLIELTEDPHLAIERRLRLARIYQRENRFDDALAGYESCLVQAGMGTWLEAEILTQIQGLFHHFHRHNELPDCLDRLADAHPGRPAIVQLQAEVLAESGRGEEALTHFERLLTRTPGDRELREAYIDLLTSLGKRKQALTSLENLSGQYPDDSQLDLKRAALFHALNQDEQAERAVMQYLEKAESAEYTHLSAARLLENYGRPDTALKVLKQCRQDYPESSAALDATARLHARQGRMAQAVKIWKQAAEDADLARVLEICRALEMDGETATALTILKTRAATFEKEPRFIGALLPLCKDEERLSWALRLVRLAKTPNDLERALPFFRPEQLSPELKQQLLEGSIPERCLLADLLNRLQDRDGAATLLEEIVKTAPRFGYHFQIRFLAQHGEYVGAAQEAEKLFALPAGRDVSTIQTIIRHYERASQFDEALTWVPRWKQLSLGSTAPWLREAELFSKMQEHDRALDVIRQASRRFENREELQSALAQGYARAGNHREAQALYERLYDLSDEASDRRHWLALLGKLAREHGEFDQLIARFETRRARNRRSSEPLLALAELHRLQSDQAARLECLRQAAKWQTQDFALLLDIATLEAEQVSASAALNTLKQARHLAHNAERRQKLAAAYFRLGDDAKGNALLIDAAHVATADVRHVLQTADAMTRSGYWRRARYHLEPYLAARPDDPLLGFAHATCLTEEGEFSKALERWLALLGINQEFATSAVDEQSPDPPAPLSRNLVAAVFGLPDAAAAQPKRDRFGGAVLPSSLHELHLEALRQIVHLGGRLPKEERASLLTRLEAHGILAGDYFFEPNLITSTRPLTLWRWRQSLPYDDVLLALSVIEGDAVLVDPTWPDVPYHRFQEKYPELAFLAIVQALERRSKLTSDARSRWRERASELLARLETPSRRTLAALLKLLESTSDPELAPWFDFALGWYRQHGRMRSDSGDWLESFVAAAFNLERFDAILTLLDEEMDLSSELIPVPPAATVNIPPGLRFPPKGLPKYPRALGLADYVWTLMPPSPARIQARASGLVRLLGYAAIRDHASAREEAHAILADRSASPIAQCYAASYAAVQEGGYERCMLSLIKARQAITDSKQQEWLDWQITLASVALPDDASEAREAGRMAARRLAAGSLSNETKTLLAKCLRWLDLPNEGKRVLNKVPGRQAHSFNGPPLQFRASRFLRVPQLSNRGNQLEALNLAQRALVKSAAEIRAGEPRSHHSLSTTFQLIASLGLTDAFLQHIDPKGNDSATVRHEYALALDNLGDREAARRIYQSFLEARPDDLFVLDRLIRFSETERDAAAIVESVLNDATSFALHWLLRRFVTERYEGTLESFIDITQASIERLKILPGSTLHGSTIESLKRRLFQIDRIQGGRISTLGPNSTNWERLLGQIKENPDPERRELMQRRVDLYESLSLLPTQAPRSARDRAFRSVADLRMAQGNEETLDELAFQSLIAGKGDRRPRLDNFGGHASRGLFRNANSHDWNPEEYLLWHRHHQGREELFSADEERQLCEQGKLRLLDSLKRCYELMRCEDAAFEPLVQDWLTTNSLPQFLPLEAVVTIWRWREIQADFMPDVIRALPRAYHPYDQGLTDCLAMYCRQHDWRTVAPLLKALAAQALGQRENWPHQLRAAARLQDGLGGPAGSFYRWLASAKWHPDLYPVLTQFYNAEVLPHLGDLPPDQWPKETGTVWEVFLSDVSRIQNSALLADLPEFDPIPVMHPQPTTIFQQIIRELRSRHDWDVNLLGVHAFGADLLRSRLENKPFAYINVLMAHEVSLRALPPENLVPISKLVASWEIPESMSEDETQLLEWLTEVTSHSRELEIKKFLTKKPMLSQNALEATLRPMLQHVLADDDFERLKALLHHASHNRPPNQYRYQRQSNVPRDPPVKLLRTDPPMFVRALFHWQENLSDLKRAAYPSHADLEGWSRATFRSPDSWTRLNSMFRSEDGFFLVPILTAIFDSHDLETIQEELQERIPEDGHGLTALLLDHARLLQSGLTEEGEIPHSANAYFHALLTDSDIPWYQRWYLGESLIRYLGGVKGHQLFCVLSDPVLDAIYALYPRAHGEGLVRAHHLMLRSLSRQERTGAWAKRARGFLPTAAKRYLTSSVSSQSQGRFHIDRAEFSDLWSIATDLGDDAFCAQVIQAGKDVADLSLALRLLGEGRHELAHQVFLNHWQRWDATDNDLGDHYHAELSEQLPKLLSRFANDDLRLLAESMIKALPDDLASKDRSARLLELAERVREHVFQSLDIQMFVLACIAAEEEATKPLLDVYADVAQGMALAQAAASHRRDGARRILTVAFKEGLSEGPQCVLDQFVKLRSTTLGLRKTAATMLMKVFLDIYEANHLSWSPEVRRKNLVIWHELVSAGAPKQDLSEWLAAGFIAHLAEDQFQSANILTQALPANTIDGVFPDEMVRLASEILSALEDDRSNERLTAMLTNPAFVRTLPHASHFRDLFATSVEAGLISQADILTNASKWIDVAPRSGYAAREVAEMCIAEGKVDAAIKMLERAMEDAGEHHPGRRARYRHLKESLEDGES